MSIPEEARSAQVDEVVAEDKPFLVVEEVGIGEIAGERRVVVTQCRRQQHRPLAIDRQVKMREISGIAMKQAFRAAWSGNCVAIVIKGGEGIAVLEGKPPSAAMR